MRDAGTVADPSALQRTGRPDAGRSVELETPALERDERERRDDQHRRNWPSVEQDAFLRARALDTEPVLWPLLVAAAAVVGFAAGWAVGWWALFGIPPVAALIWTQVELEADITAWLAFVVSFVAAAAILAGIGLERIRTRSR
jgi:hypothetical protein